MPPVGMGPRAFCAGVPAVDVFRVDTWGRIMDAASPVHAIVAERPERGVIGFSNYVIHENTWTLTPVCYLEDLFVDPAMRAAGVGAQLIDWLLAETRAEGWSRLYWHTDEGNVRARKLYDSYVKSDGHVRYRMKFAGRK